MKGSVDLERPFVSCTLDILSGPVELVGTNELGGMINLFDLGEPHGLD